MDIYINKVPINKMTMGAKVYKAEIIKKNEEHHQEPWLQSVAQYSGNVLQFCFAADLRQGKKTWDVRW